MKSLVVGIAGFVVVRLLIDTHGSCVPTFHKCSTLCGLFCNLSTLVDGNIHNNDNCLRVVVVLVVRIVVAALWLVNSVVIFVRQILVLVANSDVVDTIEVVVLIVHFDAATVEFVVDTVANYIVVAAEVVVAVANFVAVVAVPYILIDLSSSEHFHVVSIGRDRVVTQLPEPLLALVCLEVP